MSLHVAIDTATDQGSVAIGTPGTVASEVFFGSRRHAAALTPAVEEALRLAGVSLRDLSGVIVADGPGSFTGLRIGFATAQGLVRALPGIEVLTAPSLLSAAWLAARYANGPVAALYDALRGQVYAAVYQFEDDSFTVLVPPSLTTVAELRTTTHRPALAVGDGALVFADEVRRWTGRDPVGPPMAGPRASGLIELLVVRDAIRRPPDVSEWEPEYGRAAEAQVRWEEAHGKPLPGSVSDQG